MCKVAPEPQDSAAGVDLSHPPESIDADSVTRNAAYAVGTRMTTAAITAGVTIFLGRVLGPTEYGYFALAAAGGCQAIDQRQDLQAGTAHGKSA